MAILPESLEGRPLAAVLLAFAVGVLGFALSVPVGLVALVALLLFGTQPDAIPPVLTVVLGLVTLQGIAFPLAALVYLRLRGKSLAFVRARVPSLTDVVWGLVGYVSAFLLAMALVVLVQLGNAPTAERTDQALLQQPEVLLVLIPLSFLLIGPGEELLFRGVIQTTLRETFSAPAAIALASLAFAPAHIVSFAGSPTALFVSVSVLFFPSLVFGAVYEHTGNLAVPAIAHGAYNATLFGLIYVSLTLAPEAANPGSGNATALLSLL
jgi:membrane protease YdiL (CAAX protease family)